MEYPYVRCRTRMQGHDWDDYGPYPGERKPHRGFVFAHFRCARCGIVKRYEIHRSTGTLLGKPQYFDRPKDYKVSGYSPGEWRRLMLKERQTN